MPRVPKKQAELAILERFKSAYKKRFGISLINFNHRDKPDFEAIDPRTNERVGIEVTGVYQNDREARIQYWNIDEWKIFEGSTDELIASLNRCLSSKAEKSWNYDFDGKLILAILFGSLVFHNKADIDFFRHNIIVPENNFSEIWLIFRDQKDDSPELYSLQAIN